MKKSRTQIFEMFKAYLKDEYGIENVEIRRNSNLLSLDLDYSDVVKAYMHLHKIVTGYRGDILSFMHTPETVGDFVIKLYNQQNKFL